MEIKAVFIDRDGVINEDYGYIFKWEEFRFRHLSKKGLLIFQELGFKIIIITNQSGIARGFFTEKDYEILTEKYIKILEKVGIHIEKIYHCPHHPDFDKNKYICKCRKPQPGMILEAKKDFNLDLKDSIIIGDKFTDLEAGYNAGIPKRYLINKNRSKNKLVTKSFVNLLECANYIKNNF